MHRVGRVQGIVDQPDFLGAFDHVRGIAVTVSEIDPPRRAMPGVPSGAGRVLRCARGHQHQFRPRSRDRERRRRVTGNPRAIKHDPVKGLKKAVVRKPVEIVKDSRIAPPGFAVAKDGHQRPSPRLGQGEMLRKLVFAFPDRGNVFEGHQKQRALFGEERPMPFAQLQKIAIALCYGQH